jgi:hypothetical protein
VVKKLVEATQELDPCSASCLAAVRVSQSIMAVWCLAEKERGKGEREREGWDGMVYNQWNCTLYHTDVPLKPPTSH